MADQLPWTDPETAFQGSGLLYRVEQVLLIHRRTGLLLCDVARDGLDLAEPDLVSAMLTAIRDFAQDSFDEGRESGSQSFSVGELVVLVEAGEVALLAAAVKGRPDSGLTTRLRETLETVESRFAEAIAEFDGDAEGLAGAAPLLARRLEARRRPRTAATWGRMAALALAAALLVLLASVAHRGWQESRLSALVERLEAEPGITVLEAKRDGGRWHLTGARDPLARPLEGILEEAGVDPESVDAVWQEQQSAEPEIALTRARSLLKPPAGVELELSRGVLVATGSASAAWVADADRSATTIPGIGAFDRSGVEVRQAAPAEEAIAELESLHVGFAPGSTDPGPETRQVLERVARLYSDLARSEAETGGALRLVVVATGIEPAMGEVRQRLERARAEAVMHRLIGLGIAPAEIRASKEGELQAEPRSEPADAQGGYVTFSVERDPRQGRSGPEPAAPAGVGAPGRP